jgi:hypothetical protein
MNVDVGVKKEGGLIVKLKNKEVGDKRVEVKMDGVNVEGRKLIIKDYEDDKVKVKEINYGVVGKKVFFSINERKEGEGKLEIIV